MNYQEFKISKIRFKGTAIFEYLIRLYDKTIIRNAKLEKKMQYASIVCE